MRREPLSLKTLVLRALILIALVLKNFSSKEL